MTRLEELITYLEQLRLLNEHGNYTCPKEIAECIHEIRSELSLAQAEFDSMGGVVKPPVFDPHKFAEQIAHENQEANDFHSNVSEDIREGKERMKQRREERKKR